MCVRVEERERKRKKFMYERRRDINPTREATKRANWECQFLADAGSREPRRVWIFVEA